MSHASALLRSLFFLVFASATLSSLSQSPPPLTRATPDGDVILPVTTGVVGHKDDGALIELKAHLAAVGGDPWVGMVGTGTISYGAHSSTSFEATLSNTHDDAYRLDVAAPAGQTSIRIFQGFGKIQASDGTISWLPPSVPLSGLFPFEMVRADLASATIASVSVIDHGVANLGTASLHRITLESPSLGPAPANMPLNTHVIDFYFDPATHLLAKSAVYETVAGSRNVKFLFVVSYGDYRHVGSVLVPFRYTETMDGEPYLTLQLSAVDLNSRLTVHDFQF